MDASHVMLLLGSLFTVISCSASESKSIDKRSADTATYEDNDLDKRVFRYGKRSDGYIDDLYDPEDKRVFRYGKRDMDEDKRVFRFGKRDGAERERRVFRYGKRSDPTVDEALEAIKRKTFRFGKRLSDSGRMLLDYPRDIRAEPHVPFRFGEEE